MNGSLKGSWQDTFLLIVVLTINLCELVESSRSYCSSSLYLASFLCGTLATVGCALSVIYFDVKMIEWHVQNIFLNDSEY